MESIIKVTDYMIEVLTPLFLTVASFAMMLYYLIILVTMWGSIGFLPQISIIMMTLLFAMSSLLGFGWFIEAITE